MKFWICLLLCWFPGIIRAEDKVEDPPPVVSINPFPEKCRRITAQSTPGRPTASADRQVALQGGWPNEDYPPSTLLRFTCGKPFSSQEHFLQIYRISQVREAPYVSIQPLIERLRKILAERPAEHLDKVDIPIYPFRNAAALIRSRFAYFDASWGSGVIYITAFASGNGEYPTNDRLEYLFQGLSHDGKFYVSGNFSISNPRLERSDYLRLIEADKWNAILDKADELLTKAPDRSFSPRLNEIRGWLASLEIADQLK